MPCDVRNYFVSVKTMVESTTSIISHSFLFVSLELIGLFLIATLIFDLLTDFVLYMPFLTVQFEFDSICVCHLRVNRICENQGFIISI